VFHVAYPPFPQFVGSQGTTDEADGVAVSGGAVYIAAGSASLEIMPIQCEPTGITEKDDLTSAFRLRLLPNPASPEAIIRLALPAQDRVRATIHDMTGRRVRSLQDGVWSVGLHDLRWDGCDNDGRAVATGVCLVRISTAEGNTTARLVIVR
jgi:hypothetical protein